MWHKHHKEPIENSYEPSETKAPDIIDKIQSQGYESGLEEGKKLAKQFETALADEEKKLGRKMSEEEKKKFKENYLNEGLRKFLRESIDKMFRGPKGPDNE